jgi:beta-glucosidase
MLVDVGEAVITRRGCEQAIVAGAMAAAMVLVLAACSRGSDAAAVGRSDAAAVGANDTAEVGASAAAAVGRTANARRADAGSSASASGATTLGTFRDLNHNGHLDPYENSRLTPETRADDLVKRMTLDEKAGTMMHDTLPGLGALTGASAQGYNFKAIEETITTKHVTSFITRLQLPPAQLAEQNNKVQEIAQRTRLGIPVTISTDPRSHFQFVLGATSSGFGFSQWPETLGLAAIGDKDLVRRFGDIARQEYRAVGIHMALSPQADLATEPRWPRTTGTFGSRASAVSDLVGAYVEGFQHGKEGVSTDGVATIVKHWVGYGAQPNGFDAHSYYGRFAKLSDASFAQHVAAFQGALEAHSAGVMPAYPILQGVTLNGKLVEAVAPGYNKPLVTDLLRGQHRYGGLILSDWAITRDCSESCTSPTGTNPQQPPAIATPWGVEKLSRVERFAKAVNAGLDQFGGTGESEFLVDAVTRGLVSEARLDESVRRVMILKFRQGLFDNPYVDAAKAASLVGSEEFRKEGEAAQRRAQVILENHGQVLPVDTKARKVWLFGVDAAAARAAGFAVVAAPEEANLAIVRVTTPFETLHPHYFFGAIQHEGRLDFRDGDVGYEAIKRASAKVPTIVAVDMDRPAILTNVRPKAAALIAIFGASDAALLDVLSGRARAAGHLPFELPSSMEAVEGQDSAVADDSFRPLYPVGAGAT